MVGKIASSVGTPVAVDHNTIRRQSLDGPRVQVIFYMKKDPRESIELVLPNGASIQQKIIFEQFPKFCHTCHAFGHITMGCPGPEERERIRLANKKWDSSIARVPQIRRDHSQGRDTTIRGSANGKGASSVPPQVVSTMVWKPSGKNKTNGFRGADPSTSNPVKLNNRFQTFQDSSMKEIEAVQEPQPEHIKHPKRRSASASRAEKSSSPPEEAPRAEEVVVQETQLESSAKGTSIPSASRGCEPHDMSLVVIDRVEDSECEGLDEIVEMNVTLRGSNSNIDTTEFPLLSDAIAAESSKKKGRSGLVEGPQGRKVQKPPSSEHQAHPREKARRGRITLIGVARLILAPQV